MVNIDEFNRFVEWFDYGFRRLMIIMLRLFMQGCSTPLHETPILITSIMKAYYNENCFWKTIIHHENYLFKITPVAQGLTEIISHTILFISFRFAILEDLWRIFEWLMYFHVKPGQMQSLISKLYFF
jgi:hypothetical protein